MKDVQCYELFGGIALILSHPVIEAITLISSLQYLLVCNDVSSLIIFILGKHWFFILYSV